MRTLRSCSRSDQYTASPSAALIEETHTCLETLQIEAQLTGVAFAMTTALILYRTTSGDLAIRSCLPDEDQPKMLEMLHIGAQAPKPSSGYALR